MCQTKGLVARKLRNKIHQKKNHENNKLNSKIGRILIRELLVEFASLSNKNIFFFKHKKIIIRISNDDFVCKLNLN